MLGVGLRKLCPLDSFGKAFQEKKTVRKSTPEGEKPARGGAKRPFWKASGRLFCAVAPNLAAQAARKPCLGGPGGACGALGAVLGATWGVPGRSWAPLGGHFGSPQGLIDELGVVCGAT